LRYCALTSTPLPVELYGAESEIAIRKLSEEERLQIEDHFFRKDKKVAIADGTTAVVVEQARFEKGAALEEIATLFEFGLAILTVSGFQGVNLFATFNEVGDCTDAFYRSVPETKSAVVFSKNIKEGTSNIWFRQLLTARKRSKDRLHITADRFVRYSRIQNTQDALLDLCICLESLLDSTTEITFRFGICLAKIVQDSEAEALSQLLSDLYDLRSTLVHGADAAKPHKKIDPHLPRLRLAARSILTTYILYLTEHAKEDWKKHLRSSIFR
jgi:Apea-like HEPN